MRGSNTKQNMILSIIRLSKQLNEMCGSEILTLSELDSMKKKDLKNVLSELRVRLGYNFKITRLGFIE